MKCLISILFHSFLAIIILSSYTQAETIVLDVFDQGTYNSGFGYDSHFPNETEAGTGQTTYLRPVDNPGVVYRHFHNAFFVFDLTSINNIIYSANLEIELQNYYSRDSSESFAVYDVVTPIDELIAGGRQLWDPIGIDLETGIVYGSATIQQTDVGSIISIQLSDAAISDLNSSFGGFFALGVHSTTSDNPEPGLYNIDYISFGEQGDGVQQLVLETTPIPEPTYTCIGFEPPFDSKIILKRKIKRAIPVKMKLFDFDGNPITDQDVSAPPLVDVNYEQDTTLGQGYDVDLVPPGLSDDGNEFRYDPVEGLWIINLSTKQFTASGNYSVTAVAPVDSGYSIEPTCAETFERLP